MLARAVLCSLTLACAVTPANALTQEELLAKLEAAGYSQVRENEDIQSGQERQGRFGYRR